MSSGGIEGLETASDEELAERVAAGRIPVHALETQLGDCERAVKVRRLWLEKSSGKSLADLPLTGGINYEAVHGACAEMVVGYVSLPVGVAGPLLLNGTAYQVPLATVEARAGARRLSAAEPLTCPQCAALLPHLPNMATDPTC